MTQTPTDSLPLFAAAKFHGAGYDEAKDKKRLTGQLQSVYDCMSDGHKRTLRDIAAFTSAPEASVSAALRTLRNQFGYVIEKERRVHDGGTWQYWIAGGGMGEHTRTPRKMKPIGEPELFGAMMREIYALANTPREKASFARMEFAGSNWMTDMVERIRKAGENANA